MQNDQNKTLIILAWWLIFSLVTVFCTRARMMPLKPTAQTSVSPNEEKKKYDEMAAMLVK